MEDPMSAAAPALSLRVTDITGQKRRRLSLVPPQSTIGEFVRSAVSTMALPEANLEGRPLAYQARLEREGRHVHTSEIVGDVLQDDDEITLAPSIDAGAHR
jgi:hypothetical protein